MTPEELAAAAEPATLGTYLSELPPHTHHHGPPTSVREDEWRGHRILITTTYEITVDGVPLAAPLVVTNDGQVHCHALPTYEFLSATDTVRALIDNFPDDFPGSSPGDGRPGGGHPGDPHGGHHHPHGGGPEGSV